MQGILALHGAFTEDMQEWSICRKKRGWDRLAGALQPSVYISTRLASSSGWPFLVHFGSHTYREFSNVRIKTNDEAIHWHLMEPEYLMGKDKDGAALLKLLQLASSFLGWIPAAFSCGSTVSLVGVLMLHSLSRQESTERRFIWSEGTNDFLSLPAILWVYTFMLHIYQEQFHFPEDTSVFLPKPLRKAVPSPKGLGKAYLFKT